MNRLFCVGMRGKLLLVFMPHLFSKFSVFVLGDFFSSLLNNATHSILPPCSDLILLLNLILSCQPLISERAANKEGDVKNSTPELQVYIIYIIRHCQPEIYFCVNTFLAFLRALSSYNLRSASPTSASGFNPCLKAAKPLLAVM